MILNENLAGRISTHRFTQFQFDVSSDDEFEYFKRIDNEKEKLIKNISDLREHTKNLQELLDEDPPGMGQTRSVTVNDYQLEKYFLEYLDAIAQQYESFDFLSLYCLILIKLLKEHPIQDDLKKFKESHKEKVKNLYFGKNGLEKYLTELNFKEPFNSQIKDFYKSIFGDESIRELRNLKIHHYGEERIRYEKGKLHVTYPNGTSIIYSLEEIKAFKINLQLTVFLGYYMVMHSFHEMFYQRLLKEFGITSVN